MWRSTQQQWRSPPVRMRNDLMPLSMCRPTLGPQHMPVGGQSGQHMQGWQPRHASPHMPFHHMHVPPPGYPRPPSQGNASTFRPGFQPRFPRGGHGPRRGNSCPQGEKRSHPAQEGKRVKENMRSKNKASDDSHFCETCDRSFASGEKLAEHLSQHRVCGIDGCQLTAHPGVVAKHVQMQHNTGLYNKMKDLRNSEGIAKWREERRRSYPSKENVELRQAEQKEKLERGESLGKPNGRFNRDSSHPRGRGARGGRGGRGARGGRGGRGGTVGADGCSRNFNQVSTQPDVKPTNFLNRSRPRPAWTMKSVEDVDETGKCNGKLPPFLGIGLFDVSVESSVEAELPTEQVEMKEDFNDAEWSATAPSCQLKVEPKMSSALSNLLNLYGSDSDPSDSEAEKEHLLPAVTLPTPTTSGHRPNTEVTNSVNATKIVQALITNKTCGANLSDNGQVSMNSEDDLKKSDSCGSDAPDEVPIIHSSVDHPLGSVETNEDVEHSEGNSRKRKRNHKHQDSTAAPPTIPQQVTERAAASNRRPNHYKRRHLTLLEKLLSSEIRHERNVMLQCIRYTVGKSFFQSEDQSHPNHNAAGSGIEQVNVYIESQKDRFSPLEL